MCCEKNQHNTNTQLVVGFFSLFLPLLPCCTNTRQTSNVITAVNDSLEKNLEREKEAKSFFYFNIKNSYKKITKNKLTQICFENMNIIFLLTL